MLPRRTDTLEDTDLEAPDDASDLFGYPPRRPCVCPACGLSGEPYSGQFCWKCTMTGDAGRTLGHPCFTEAERDVMSGLAADIKAGRISRDERGTRDYEGEGLVGLNEQNSGGTG